MNTEERLINGQMGTVKHIEIKENKIRTAYLELDYKCTQQIIESGSDVTAEKMNGFKWK